MSGEVMTRMVLIHQTLARVLFDSSASHYFISASFITMHSLQCESLKVSWSISTGNGAILANRQCIDYPIVINGRRLFADFLVLDSCEFDAVLRMEWLCRHHAIIDCRRGCVVFCIPEKPEFEFQRNNKTVHPAALWMISSGGILMTIQADGKLDPEVATNFLDIFEEVTGLPPKREVEFSIMVLLGMALVSRAPYRMAPMELVELKKQVQELLDKRFIRPSDSPWGAPILLFKKKDGRLRLCINY